MTAPGAILAMLTPGAGVDAMPLAQGTSERLGLTVAALIALAVLAVLGGVLVALLRRQAQARALRRQGQDDAGAGAPGGGLWAAGGTDGATDDEPGPEPREPAPAAPAAAAPAAPPAPPAKEAPGDEGLVVRPPLPGEAWVAEIIWAAHATRFRVVARRSDDADAEPVAVAQTEPLPWPPKDDASVQALTDASSTLEAVLLDSGWSALPVGQAWYSKRFAWAPQAVEEAPARATGRFDRRRARVPHPVPQDPVAHDAGPLRQ